MAKSGISGLRRRLTSLLIACTFIVMAVTGVLGFFRPFSIEIVGLHALMGFVFIVFALAHLLNNSRQFKGYLRNRTVWLALAVSGSLTALFFLQPTPVKAVLGLSENLGPALDRFEMTEDGMLYQYSPSLNYKMELTVRTGDSFEIAKPPQVAIWLENQGGYHIKTLHLPEPEAREELPYWAFKRKGWEVAKEESESGEEPDAISEPTPNGSFDPADYILPADPGNSTPYQLLIEINQPGDAHGDLPDQASLVYAVEIDNASPSTFQLLDLIGYPTREDEDGKETWSLFFVDDRFGSALSLIDSALLTIERSQSLN
ncbi:MAG: hypothetical protein ACJA16_005763 [Akkermansiaceae bacterium]|jgi:hypothetical protein